MKIHFGLERRGGSGSDDCMLIKKIAAQASAQAHRLPRTDMILKIIVSLFGCQMFVANPQYDFW
jgi:hypothetical protein